MSLRMITTCIAVVFFAGVFITAGCGGGDSPTQSTPTPTTPPAPPAPPPAPTVSVVEVSPNMATLEVGKTQRFVATAKASDGTVISGVDFTWSSSNTAVVTINNNGVATAVAAGSATIRATGDGVASASVPITVTVAAVARVTISPSSTQDLMIGDMVTFTATARTAGGAIRGDVSISWASSDTSVVTITSAGVATAVGPGTAMVRATADGIASSPVTINVAEPPPPEPVVSTVTVSPTEEGLELGDTSIVIVEEGQTRQLEANATKADGTPIEDVEFTWSSSNEMVATVDANGLATGVSVGEVMITATADGVSGSVTLAVVPPIEIELPILPFVMVTPPEAMIEAGEMQQFTAMVLAFNGIEIPDVEFTWSSSNVLVAMVDANGLATGVGAGEAMITATADSISGMATLTVTEPEEPPPPPEPTVASVTVSPSEATVKEGETQQFSATAYDSENNEISGKTFAWTSSNPLIATVNSSGLAAGRDAGSVTITATTDGESDDATLTIEARASRTATISGTTSYPNTAGSVTFEEVAGGKLKLTITGMNTGGGVQAHLFLYTTASINWRSGTVPDGARHFGNVTGRSSFTNTFTPRAGETIDSYSHVILHCALVNMPLGSGSF